MSFLAGFAELGRLAALTAPALSLQVDSGFRLAELTRQLTTKDNPTADQFSEKVRNDTLNGPMDMRSHQSDGARNGSVAKRRSAVFLIVAVISVALVIAAILVPGQVDSRMAMNEAVAIGSLRTITTLQNQYAAENPSKGFACELAQLRDVTHRNGEADHEALLVSQSYAGYKFLLIGCELGPNGVVIRYQATAIPRLPGETGVRAFCEDQTGQFWYATNGSAENCLVGRQPLR